MQERSRTCQELCFQVREEVSVLGLLLVQQGADPARGGLVEAGVGVETQLQVRGHGLFLVRVLIAEAAVITGRDAAVEAVYGAWGRTSDPARRKGETAAGDHRGFE